MSPEHEDDFTTTERLLDRVELVAATFACVALATSPGWAAAIAYALGLPVAPVFFPLFVAVVVVPGALRTKRTKGLDGYQRWGTNMGRFLGAPLRYARRRAQRRHAKVLGAAGTSAAVRALDDGTPRGR